MKLTKRLTRFQAASVALFITGTLVSIAAAQVLANSAADLRGSDVPRLQSALSVSDLISELKIAETVLVLDHSRTSRNELSQRRRRMTEELQKLHRLAIKNDPPLVDGLQRQWNDYVSAEDRFLALAVSGRPQEAIASLNGELASRYDAMNAAADRLAGSISAEVKQESDRALLVERLAIWAVMLLGAGAIAATLYLRAHLHRRVARPFAAVLRSLTALAGGDLRISVQGQERDDEIGDMARALEVFRRHAQSLDQARRDLQASQAEAARMARHDALTGLANRRRLVDELAAALKRPKPFALLMIDLDHFKVVNDMRGHGGGDIVLTCIARRLVALAPRGAVVARLSADEFAMLVPASDTSAVIAMAEDVLKAAATPIDIGGCEAILTASVGIAVSQADGETVSALLRASDLAMQQVKQNGRCAYRFFEPEMHAAVEQRVLMERQLRQAVAAGDIRPYYQPLVSIEDGSLVGFEALARWITPNGVVSPDAFIPLAEQRGILPELTFHLVEQICRDARHWPAHLTVSVNLSPKQLADPQLAARMIAILTANGFRPGRLEIELTEDSLIGDLEAVKRNLAALQALGMKIVLDDFGTGYSSLNHLREMQFDKIKLDKCFIRELTEGGCSEQLVTAMLAMGKSLGLATTAEGVEDVKQWNRLSELGCDFGQGYHFGRPMPADRAARFVRDCMDEPPLLRAVG